MKRQILPAPCKSNIPLRKIRRAVEREMTKSFLDRRHAKEAKYNIQANITGIRLPDGKIHWNVEIDGETDNETAAGILEKAAEVLRMKE